MSARGELMLFSQAERVGCATPRVFAAYFCLRSARFRIFWNPFFMSSHPSLFEILSCFTISVYILFHDKSMDNFIFKDIILHDIPGGCMLMGKEVFA